jgi:hypothetical protein
VRPQTTDLFARDGEAAVAHDHVQADAAGLAHHLLAEVLDVGGLGDVTWTANR